MWKHLKWLWAMHCARLVYRSDVVFSRRQRFMSELRPKLDYGEDRIAYPDAIFFVEPTDVRRAEQCTK